MYRRSQFHEDRQDVLVAVMRDLRFATLVSSSGTELLATHLPVSVKQNDAGITLEMHVARGNAQWRELDGSIDALVLFLGPHAYVTPTWYASKAEHQRVVPTWNYIAVQASGPMTVHDDVPWLLRHVRELTDANEAGRADAWSVDDAPSEFIASQCRAIVGFSVEVRKLEGSWKLAQHRSEADRRGVIAGLQQSGEPAQQAIAAAMEKLEAEHQGLK